MWSYVHVSLFCSSPLSFSPRLFSVPSPLTQQLFNVLHCPSFLSFLKSSFLLQLLSLRSILFTSFLIIYPFICNSVVVSHQSVLEAKYGKPAELRWLKRNVVVVLVLYINSVPTILGTKTFAPGDDPEGGIQRFRHNHPWIATRDAATMPLSMPILWMRWSLSRTRTLSLQTTRSLNRSGTSIYLGRTPGTVKRWSQCLTKSQLPGTRQSQTLHSRKIPLLHSKVMAGRRSRFGFSIWKKPLGWKSGCRLNTSQMAYTHLGVLDSGHASELGASFGDRSLDYSRRLILVTAVRPVDGLIYAMDIVYTKDGGWKLLKNCRTELMDAETG